MDKERFILQMSHINKSFPGVRALDDVSFSVREGTIHALMGENGAGKSTLMKILSGYYKADSGEILFQGKPLDTSSINHVLEQGISMIYQELNPIDYLTVAENIYCGKEPSHFNSGFFLNTKKLNQDAQKLLDRLSMKGIKPTAKVGSLSIGQKQLLEIAKAVANNSKLIIMDEPTSAITESECQYLFSTVKQLKKEGVAFIFITHKMDEVFAVADDITIMRDGRFVKYGPIKEFTRESLISLMVGRDLTQIYPKEEVEIGEVMFEVKHLSSGKAVKDVSFSVRRGEILGFSGLMGSGRSETMETIIAVRKRDSGEILIDGKPIHIRKPLDALKEKIAFLTEDRRGSGCFLELDVYNNLAMLSWKNFSSFNILRHSKCRKEVNKYVDHFGIKISGLKQVIATLSGGNQQKVLLSRALMIEPEILILDEPTRGIDVGAKHEIYMEIERLAKMGKAIIMISSDLPEVLGMSDRIAVMSEGKLVKILDRSEATQENIMTYASGITAAG